MTPIDRLRQKINDRDYFLSSHAEDEMVDDLLERRDVEQAIRQGRIEKVMTEDDRVSATELKAVQWTVG
jgi:DNA polymerase/3'-5' exonuclease PolX